MPATSPFDDAPADAEPAPRRRRRPWWRWNLITLMAVLFVMAWVRAIAGLGGNVTWATVGVIIALWLIAPQLILELTAPTPLPDDYRRAEE